MSCMDARTTIVNWSAVESELHEKGYYHSPGFLTSEETDHFIEHYDDHAAYRKTVVMERHRFGKGEYKYFNYPLPPRVNEIRQSLYPHLVPVANLWMQQLRMKTVYPPTLNELLTLCRRSDQYLATPLILRYGVGGFNTLHQDLYGGVYFPFQAVIMLNESGRDFEGGEFVLIQQTPRAQSKAIVLAPKKGDMVIFTTNFRPIEGKLGYYRTSVKHGVSEVRWGVRHTLGIIFHDAVT